MYTLLVRYLIFCLHFITYNLVVDLLFNVLPIVCGSSVFDFVLLCITLCPLLLCNHFEEKEKADCFAIFVLQIYFYYKFYVALGLQYMIVVFPDHTHLHFGRLTRDDELII